MQVKLISLTRSVITTHAQKKVDVGSAHDRLSALSAEEVIVYTARVSNPNNQNDVESSPKLLAYLIKHGHWSPFEMASMTLEIVTSRGIAPQILRHRSFSFQEFSLRYSQAVEREVYSARRQDSKNRQNSIDDLPPETKAWFEGAQAQLWDACYEYYKSAINLGIAKEQARFLLPLSTQTKLYMCGSIRSWIHYLQVRDAEGVQKEHRDIAIEAKKIFIEQFPNIAKALEWS